MDSQISKLKKITAGALTAVLLLVQSPVVYGQIPPTPPEPPSAPTAPKAPEAPEPPESPTAPEPPSPPEAPEAPEAPQAPSAPSALEVPEPPGDSEPPSNSETETDSGPDSSGSDSISDESTSSNDPSSTGQTADGQVGDPSIEIGDAVNTASIVNNANTNLSATPSGGGGGVKVINEGNGSSSDNSGSVKIVDDKVTIQDNSAKVVNDLNQTSNTGNNSASKNVGNSSIETGDANTTGTIVNAVNTNVDGVEVYEFNVVDDQIGDIVLDFSGGCIQGCGQGDILAKNSGNGADSTNNAEIDSVTNNDTFQNNDATVENNMTLASNSGDNKADKNTGGDSTIETGDANVAANVLNFANNNLAGKIIYTVVNIFGDLIGDIIFPGSAFSSVAAVNSGNGDGSTNTASIDQSTSDNTLQFNEANIENDLVFDATTGDNEASRNTNGSSSIETGDASVEAQVVNIANMNLAGGDWWLVIVNEAGKWIGKIFGAPEGSFLAASDGLEFVVGPDGEITVVNSGNGADSTNTASVSQETNNTLVQTNTANIVNNVNLSANTGGNSTSRNTGGDNSIKTGDASIIANIVNFVNNNIVGDGRLFVNVINVFGSWLGDFISPGYTKESDTFANSESENSSAPAIGGAAINSSSQGGNSGSSSNNEGSGENEGVVLVEVTPTPAFISSGNALASAVITAIGSADILRGSDIGFTSGGDDVGEDTQEKKVIDVNLAWLTILLPAYFGITVARRKFAAT